MWLRSDWLPQLSLTIWCRWRWDGEILLRQLLSEPLRQISKLHPLTPANTGETSVTMETASTSCCGEQKQEVACPTGSSQENVVFLFNSGDLMRRAQIKTQNTPSPTSSWGGGHVRPHPHGNNAVTISQVCHHVLGGCGRGQSGPLPWLLLRKLLVSVDLESRTSKSSCCRRRWYNWTSVSETSRWPSRTRAQRGPGRDWT